jgi:hypothetical protein
MKPFRGVIQNWYRFSGGIRGHVVWDGRHNHQTGEYAPGHRIQTSTVIRLKATKDSDFTMLETANSYYALLGKERELRA